ncbi:hypothetical protein GIB67_013440 [Kingdonia uniflora]|uniref:F-box domain-containing protein n=1 Tax=Kingdonia uniflora TaxID=39325 RepID=A0A7J7LR94_9MAGN|nr:hypothetical protein GIB67_013440 [Kingdonia uniflora]
MSKLPEDIEIEILSWVPAKTLARFRCVCKPWCQLTLNPTFVHLNINRYSKTNPRLLISETSEKQLIYSLDSKARDAKPKRLNLPFFIKIPRHHVEVNGSCNGVVCLSKWEDCYLWNPITNEHVKLPYTPFVISSRFSPRTVFGFGYNSRTKEYKVVRFEFSSHQFGAKVYTLGRDSWKILVRQSNSLYEVSSYNGVVQLNGAIHWMGAYHYHPYPYPIPELDYEINLIISFNLESEELQEIPCPSSLEFENNYFSMCVLEGCLSMFYDDYGDHVEMWVMKDYGVMESWTKLFSIEVPPRSKYTTVLYIPNDGNTLISNDHRFRPFSVTGVRSRFKESCTHIETLLSIASLMTRNGVEIETASMKNNKPE